MSEGIAYWLHWVAQRPGHLRQLRYARQHHCCDVHIVRMRHRPWRHTVYRCTVCGHRTDVLRAGQRQTREQPFWSWPFELLDRRRARRVHWYERY